MWAGVHYFSSSVELALIIPQQVRLCLIFPEDRPVRKNRVFCCDMLQNAFFSPVPARSPESIFGFVFVFFPHSFIHCGNLMELLEVKLTISWEPPYDSQEFSTFSLQELNHFSSNFPISTGFHKCLHSWVSVPVRHSSLRSSAHLSSLGGSGSRCVLLSLWIWEELLIF